MIYAGAFFCCARDYFFVDRGFPMQLYWAVGAFFMTVAPLSSTLYFVNRKKRSE
jgi:hypothetical protein